MPKEKAITENEAIILNLAGKEYNFPTGALGFISKDTIAPVVPLLKLPGQDAYILTSPNHPDDWNFISSGIKVLTDPCTPFVNLERCQRDLVPEIFAAVRKITEDPNSPFRRIVFPYQFKLLAGLYMPKERPVGKTGITFAWDEWEPVNLEKLIIEKDGQRTVAIPFVITDPRTGRTYTHVVYQIT